MLSSVAREANGAVCSDCFDTVLRAVEVQAYESSRCVAGLSRTASVSRAILADMALRVHHPQDDCLPATLFALHPGSETGRAP